MARSKAGIITIVQEGRFQMTDDAGISHLFILSPHAGAEPAQLATLRQRQMRVRVRYTHAENLIGNLATAIYADE